MMRFLAVALFLLALVPACTTQTTSSPVRTLEVKASLDTLWTRYAFASDAHDAGGFALLFVDDATLALPGVPTKRGRAAIEECLGSLYSGVDATALRIDQHDLSVAGATAFQSGAFEEDFTEAGVAKTRYGRFAAIVEQGKDRAWRIRHLTALADSVRP
ncbi:MAG: SgcJ/EcaC family oxidoreductase [Candidatus Eisenbacteria bacterium]